MTDGLVQYKPQTQDVDATARWVKVPPRLYTQIANIGFTTIDVDVSGGEAVAEGIQTVRLPPGDGISLPPTGLDRFSAIALVDGGKLLILGDTFPIPTQARRNDQTGRIIRGFDHTNTGDINEVAYDIDADFITTAGGHRVRSLTIEMYLFPGHVNFDAPAAAAVPSVAMAVGDILTINDLELIDSINIINDAAGADIQVIGFVVGD